MLFANPRGVFDNGTDTQKTGPTALELRRRRAEAGGDAESATINRDPKKHISINILKAIPTLLGFIIRGFIWDIPILIFAYVLFWGPNKDSCLGKQVMS